MLSFGLRKPAVEATCWYMYTALANDFIIFSCGKVVNFDFINVGGMRWMFAQSNDDSTPNWV